MSSNEKPLTDSSIKALKDPGQYWQTGEKGLYLDVGVKTKSWRYKYTLKGSQGKQGRYTIGQYPAISIAEARQLAREAQLLVARGIAPKAAKTAKIEAQRRQDAHTFERVARTWLEHKAPTLVPITLTRYQGALEGHVFDHIGKMPIADIRFADVSAIIDGMRKTPGAARHTFGLISQVLDFAELRELVERNVCAGKRRVLPERKEVQARAALMTAAEIGGFLRALDAYPGRGVGVAAALRCSPYLPVRPGELVTMHWDNVDLDAGTWSFRMSKVNREHIVPLPAQVVTVLRELQQVGGGKGYVFKSNTHRGRPICRDSLWAGILRLGYDVGELSAHGWRATFRTVAREQLRISRDVLELSLGHLLEKLGKAYDRTELLDERKEAAQRYADWLDAAKASSASKG
ncbi:integrase [Metapseudomonas resinovorans]|uniref:tyrosine-type recombinase/integrase n=1 Tax=Metapseudomonas resinovorans TaxID=53412 RepID=UPI003D1D416B